MEKLANISQFESLMNAGKSKDSASGAETSRKKNAFSSSGNLSRWGSIGGGYAMYRALSSMLMSSGINPGILAAGAAGLGAAGIGSFLLWAYLDNKKYKKRLEKAKLGESALLSVIEKKLEENPENQYYKDVKKLLQSGLYKNTDYLASIDPSSEINIREPLTEQEYFDELNKKGTEDDSNWAQDRALKQLKLLIGERAKTNQDYLYLIPAVSKLKGTQLTNLLDYPEAMAREIEKTRDSFYDSPEDLQNRLIKDLAKKKYRGDLRKLLRDKTAPEGLKILIKEIIDSNK